MKTETEKKKYVVTKASAVRNCLIRLIRRLTRWAWKEEIAYADYVRTSPDCRYAMRQDEGEFLWYVTERCIPGGTPEGKTYVSMDQEWREKLLPHVAEGQWSGYKFIAPNDQSDSQITDQQPT